MGQGMHLVVARDRQQHAGWGVEQGSVPEFVGPTAAPFISMPPEAIAPTVSSEDGHPPRPVSGDGLLVLGDDARVDRIARSRISVLIQGETGTGKEVLAQRLHQRSDRAERPLVTVNCAGFCANLLESELFGHQRGAFTGAQQTRIGLVEAADGGTLFLDEVGELSGDAQTKLLRVLEAREVLRVGTVTPRRVDVRFIAATNVDLRAATAAGHFREDLLYRLEGIRLCLPPLRSRLDEVVPAAMQFLEAFARRERQSVPTLTRAAEVALRRHTWKGNFRELRNVMERAVLICSEGRIQAADLMLPEAVPVPVPTVVPRLVLADAPPTERERIMSALNECAGNQTRAAHLLGISRRTLVTRLKTFGLARPRPRALRIPSTAQTAS